MLPDGVHATLRRGVTAYRALDNMPPFVVQTHKAYRRGDRLTWLSPSCISLSSYEAAEFEGEPGKSILYKINGVTDGIDMRR
eukprot:gene8707-12692_t